MDILTESLKGLEGKGDNITSSLELTVRLIFFILLQTCLFEAWSELLLKLFNAEILQSLFG